MSRYVELITRNSNNILIIISGDSGGPLRLLRSDGTIVLAGVVSYGAAAGCELDYPAVFTRVHSFLDWIQAKSGIQIS